MWRALAVASLAIACRSRDEPRPTPPPPAPADAATPVAPGPPARGVAMTPTQAKAAIADAMALAAAAHPDCDRIANALVVALPIAAPKADAESAPAWRALQKCALATKRWRAAVHAGVALLGARPDTFTVAQIVRALAEMGQYDKAHAVAAELTKRFPAAHAPLASAEVFVDCRAEAWEQCERGADAALAELDKAGADPRDRDVVVAHELRDFAWIVLGKPKQALADVAALEQLGKLPDRTADPFPTIEREGARAVERGFYLELLPSAQLPTGVYHLMGHKDTGALVTVKLREHTGAARRFRIEAEVPGVTEKSSNTLELGANQYAVKLVNPPLKIDFDPSKLRAPRPSQLALRLVELTGGREQAVLDETIPIQVLPRDYLPLARRTGADSVVPTFGFLAAWVTPTDHAIDELLTRAKQRLASHAFAGEADPTVPQVAALFDELKARGVTYVMDPEVTSATSYVQRTRLPAEVLATTNAQCLEASLVFASLIEAIGLHPILVIVPGHAFVGWHTGDRDGLAGAPRFLETTMLAGYSFDQAMNVASHRFEQETAAGAFTSGAATSVDIAELRKLGYTAQPL